MFGRSHEDRASPLSAAVLAGALALAVGFGYVALRAYSAMAFPYQIDPEEGFILNQAMMLSRGESFYHPINEAPFTAGTYAPLYQFIATRGPALALESLLGLLMAVYLWDAGKGLAGLAALGALGFVICAEVHGLRVMVVKHKLHGVLFPSMTTVRVCQGFVAAVLSARVSERRGLFVSLLTAAVFFGACEINAAFVAPLLGDWAAGAMLEARAPAVASELVCGCLVGVGVFAMGRRNLLAAAFAGLMFFASAEVYNWTGFARVDFMALFFNLLGLLFITQGEKRMDLLVASGACFAAALFTKQSQIMAPLAGCLFLLWRRPKWGAWFALALVAVVAAVAGLLQVLTGGQYLLHTVKFNANVLYWDQLLKYAAHLWRFLFLIWMALAVAAARQIWLAAYLRRAGGEALAEPELDAYQKAKDPWVDLSPEARRLPYEADWTPFFLVPCLLSLIGFAKAGVSYNYFLDPWAAICLYLGVRMGKELAPGPWLRLRPHPALKAGHAMGVAVVLLMTAHAFFVLTPFRPDTPALKRERPTPPRFTVTAANPAEVDVKMAEEVEAAIRRTAESGGEFLAELPIFEIRAQKPVVWQPFIMAQLTREGKWDDKPMVASFAQKRYALLVATRPMESDAFNPNYTEAMVKAIRGSYQLSKAVEGSYIFNYYLYVPKP